MVLGEAWASAESCDNPHQQAPNVIGMHHTQPSQQASSKTPIQGISWTEPEDFPV